MRIFLPFVPLLYFVVGSWLADSARAVDYHVAATGDDAHEGTTPQRAWKTVDRANRQEFRPGDRLLFQGGHRYVGNLVVKTAGTPSATTPVTVGSYDASRAIIFAGD